MIKYLYLPLFKSKKELVMKLIILGPPGSGKGTVSEKLAKEFKLFHLSAGDLLREEIRRKTSLGKQIQKYIDTGNLVPPHLVVEMVKEKLGKKMDYILDGFPRSLDQATKIEEVDAVIYLSLPEKAIIKRLSGRRIDPITGKTYHLRELPPPRKIAKRLIQRNDDLPSVVKKRLKVYHRETEPVIKYYQNKRILKKINGKGEPQEVYERVRKAMKEMI